MLSICQNRPARRRSRHNENFTWYQHYPDKSVNDSIREGDGFSAKIPLKNADFIC